jgi:hypothetical protein
MMVAQEKPGFLIAESASSKPITLLVHWSVSEWITVTLRVKGALSDTGVAADDAINEGDRLEEDACCGKDNCQRIADQVHE